MYVMLSCEAIVDCFCEDVGVAVSMGVVMCSYISHHRARRLCFVPTCMLRVPWALSKGDQSNRFTCKHRESVALQDKRATRPLCIHFLITSLLIASSCLSFEVDVKALVVVPPHLRLRSIFPVSSSAFQAVYGPAGVRAVSMGNTPW